MKKGVKQIGVDSEDNLKFGGEGEADYFKFEEGNGIVLAARPTLP